MSDTPLLDGIRELEKLSDEDRFEWIVDRLKKLKCDIQVQQYSSGQNIIIPADKKPAVIVSSHYDTVPGTPGANDNGSAIVICLDILEKLKNTDLKNIGVQVFFFDEEEEGLIGSEAFCQKNGVDGFLGMFNMELVGQGNIFALWPLNDLSKGVTFETFEKIATQKGIPSKRFDQIVTNSADHRPFKEHGLDDVFTITCISPKDIEVAQEYYAALEKGEEKEGLREIMAEAPLFRNYHRPTDTSDHLSEDTLRMTADTIFESIIHIDRNM